MRHRKRSGRDLALTLAIAGVLGACGTSEGSTPDAVDDGAGDVDASIGTDAGGEAGSAGSDDGAAGELSAGSDAPLPSTDGPTFDADVHPLLVASCGSCHAQTVVSGPPRPGGPGEGGANGPGKFAVDDAAAAYAAVLPYVVASDPEHSALYIKISEDMPSTGGQRMPPALRQWDDTSIETVRAWIAGGAPQR